MKQVFSVKVDTRKFNQHLTDIARKQVPFAAAFGLTKTAKDAQAATDREMNAVMTVRSPFVKRGLIVTPARRSDGILRMQSMVGHRAWYMAQQMGKRSIIRKPRTAEYEYIPRGVRRTKKGSISRNYRIKNVFKLKGTYMTEEKNGRAGVFRVVAGRPRLLYSAIRQQTVEPKMDLMDIAERTAAKRMARNFIEGMRRGIKTAR
ncbi:phage tail protein [Sneathiella sp.]|uniref:phage tail protein n=1 Tax=Sneathiella sp. TaxID=1964365 RepID=UPI002FE14D61